MTDPMNTSDIQTKIAQTRAQLEETLDAIEDKFNVPKQLGFGAKKAQASFEENPVPWIAGAAAAVVLVGGLIVAAVFSRD